MMKKTSKTKHVRSIADDCESCQNETSALTASVNRGNFALSYSGDLHKPMAHPIVVHAKLLHLFCLIIRLGISLNMWISNDKCHGFCTKDDRGPLILHLTMVFINSFTANNHLLILLIYGYLLHHSLSNMKCGTINHSTCSRVQCSFGNTKGE